MTDRRIIMRDALRISAAALLYLLISACEPAQQVPATTRQFAELVFRNASVYTVVPGSSWAQAVAVSNGTILYAGDDGGAAAWMGPRTKVIDLGGKMLLPAFQDAHVHPLDAGVDYQLCPLFAYTTADEYVQAVGKCADARPGGDWVIGSGWLLSAFPPEGIPDKKLLDAVSADRPVALTSADGHSLWTNTRAMAIAGITANTPDPPNGRIDRDPRSGQLLGSFQESAMDLIRLHTPPPSTGQLLDALRYSVRLMNGFGITAWQDASVAVQPDDPFQALNIYREVRESGELTVHVVESLLWDNDRGLEQLDEIRDAARLYAADGLNTRTVKIFLDGVVETQTAALIEDYTDRPGFSSQLQVAPGVLNEAVTRLDADGFQVHIHAIGDRAVRAALDAFEQARSINGSNDNRHHIAHVQMVHPDDQGRFVELAVVANFQPLWAFADDYIVDLTYPRIGEERIKYVYPIGSLRRSGATVAFGSDWSVSSVNPLEGIEVAVTRMGPAGETTEAFLPEQRIDLADAIAGYTRNAAYVNHLDATTGTIETGKRADLIVLDRNLFEIQPAEISDARVLLTLFGGRVVYGSLEDLALH
ncbi:MAG: amidohydrolase [Gammaproteobacteria bacterium]|nr:amidohydrolase [Gammaproteobacteria bacterium]